ncbi:hypothetical protein CLV58_109208 [Spirosoma oryzae]|uniref:Uncharacterized protein n=1 Tax=Spirosoma oryzae TaxID=1469603 RepID=A0A2T0SYH1_9BACT|nr:hypothetical protein [Spirosoma oryzae]PRY38481.1 hypothetical protein CLV58_109208 [Spirosoma oryzae]
MNDYEIWIGYYHLGQGYDPPTKPEKVAQVNALSFKIACVLYEHQRSIDYLIQMMEEGKPLSYIDNLHLGSWNYNPKTNSNSWTGRYYESEIEALKSFPIQS